MRDYRALVLVGLLLLSTAGSFAQGQLPTKENVAEEMRRRFMAFDFGPDAPANLDAILQSSYEGVGFGYRSAAPRTAAFGSLDSGGVAAGIKRFLDSMEYYHTKFQELHTSVEGDIGLAWGIFVEDFKARGQRPEVARVRFTQVLKKEGVRWRPIMFHRDIQPFDKQGRYLTQFTRVPVTQ